MHHQLIKEPSCPLHSGSLESVLSRCTYSQLILIWVGGKVGHFGLNGILGPPKTDEKGSRTTTYRRFARINAERVRRVRPGPSRCKFCETGRGRYDLLDCGWAEADA